MNVMLVKQMITEKFKVQNVFVKMVMDKIIINANYAIFLALHVQAWIKTNVILVISLKKDKSITILMNVFAKVKYLKYFLYFFHYADGFTENANSCQNCHFSCLTCDGIN